MIESTGISEPLPVAETFTFGSESGRSLSSVARLDTLVTVVDGANFLDRWPDDPEYRGYIMEKWQEPFGDMRQALDECLISEVELLAGKQAWESLPDPFPAWE